MWTALQRFMRDEAGQDVLEWILVAVIVIGAATVAFRLVTAEFRSAANRLIEWIKCAWTGGTCPS